MATVDAVVLGHHRKADGTYNVKFRVSHKGIKRYIDTEHFVSDRQLDRKGKIKDTFLLRILDRTLDTFRDLISELDTKVEFFTAETLKDSEKVEYHASITIKSQGAAFSRHRLMD